MIYYYYVLLVLHIKSYGNNCYRGEILQLVYETFSQVFHIFVVDIQ